MISDCLAVAYVRNSHAQNGGKLMCYLPANHDGLHWDEPDGIYWRTAEKGE